MTVLVYIALTCSVPFISPLTGEPTYAVLLPEMSGVTITKSWGTVYVESDDSLKRGDEEVPRYYAELDADKCVITELAASPIPAIPDSEKGPNL